MKVLLATKDTLDLIYASNDKIWNHLLYSLIIKHNKIKDLKLNYRNIKGNFYFYKSYKKNNSKIKEEIKIILSKVGNFFKKMMH